MAPRRATASQARAAPFNFWRGLKELSLFFQGKDEVHKSMRRLARRLDRAGIPYAVVGGMAVFAHKHRRATNDVDVLVTAEGLQAFRQKLEGKNYRRREGRARKFVDRLNDVGIDFLVAGMFPGTGARGPIVYPDPDEVAEVIDKVRVINLVDLIQLKLAARRYQDFADVVNLISAHDLDESFAKRLHPSVRQDYIECLEEKRREDEYEARNG
jgi:hypothetical protein